MPAKEPLVAQGLAQYVHVPRDVAGADVREHLLAAGALGTPFEEPTGFLLGPVVQAGGDRGELRIAVTLGIGVAVERRLRGADAARVEPE
ncbi:hypothetical protein [Nonomuraea sp. NPDC049141]|uniref:hypothetical protein n=1 Tax=Nonomuraea sp. NPDC049141 TaxID=3155500 RepID=UPI0033C2D7A0